MELNTAGWIVIVVLLCLSTFGIHLCISVILIFITFFAGILTVLYLAYEDNEKTVKLEALLDNPLEQTTFRSSLAQVMHKFQEQKKNVNRDKRISGSEKVDSFLNEIIGLLIRDYVYFWYSTVTNDNEFVEEIQFSARALLANISNRVKSVNWLSYLTGRFVEDTVCHLRLFRAAGGGNQPRPSRRGSPRRGSPARSPAPPVAHHHRRNKSDTDVVAIFSPIPRNITNSRFYTDNRIRLNMTFEQRFFELEREMEGHLISREIVCNDNATETGEVMQIILYLTYGTNDIKGGATWSIIKAMLCFTLQAALRYATDPDMLNTILLRCCTRDGLSSESFISVLRTTDDLDELKSTLELVQKEIQKLVSRDSGGECDISVKQQLSSLQFLVKMINEKSSVVPQAPCPTMATTSSSAITDLPMGFLLENHLGLCYFLDFAQSMGSHPYVFCHLSIQGWKSTVVKYLSGQNLDCPLPSSSMEDIALTVKMAAQGIYEQFLSTECSSRLDISSGIVDSLLINLRTPLNEKSLTWFDHVEAGIRIKLKSVEAGFRNSTQYSRLLAELDMEGTNIVETLRFAENRPLVDNNTQVLFGSKTSLNSLSDGRLSDQSSEGHTDKHSGHLRFSLDSSPSSRSQSPTSRGAMGISGNEMSGADDKESQESLQKWLLRSTPCHLETVIVETGVVQERGRSFGVYAVEVRRRCPTTGRQHCWHVYRRYSDFYQLNAALKDTYSELGKLEFPSKKTFHNTSRSVLERRMVSLGTWLAAVAALGGPGGPPRYAGLHPQHLLPFLSPRGPHDKPPQQRAIDTMLVQPLRQGMRTLQKVPGHLVNTVDDFMEGISKVLGNTNKLQPMAIVPCRLQEVGIGRNNRDGSPCNPEELPLRVLLLLLDEIFELKKRNRWFRRQISGLLRQLVTAMFADFFNKRIVDLIDSFTTPVTVVNCLDIIKRNYCSSCSSDGPRVVEPRDPQARARARVAVKTVLLSSRQEELKRIVGSETTHRGLMTVFELFQNPILNKRLIFVLSEGFLGTLYPEHNMQIIFQRLLRVSQREPFVFKKPLISHI